MHIVDLVQTETCLRRHPAVSDCAVRLRHSVDGQQRIVAYVQCNGPWNPDALRTSLESQLDTSLLPDAFIQLTRMPLTASGESDEDALGKVPVIDAALLQHIEGLVNSRIFPERARIVLEENIRRSRPLHLSDLLPGWKADSSTENLKETSTEDGTPAAEPGRMAWSDGGPLRMPAGAPSTLTEAFLRTAASHPGKGVTYVTSRGHEVFESYGSILQRATRILGGLRAKGMKPHDSVILQITSLQDHFPGFWACILGGFHPVTVAVAPSYEQTNAVVMKLYNTWELLRRPPILASRVICDSIKGVTALVGGPGFEVLELESLERTAEALDFYRPDPLDVVFYQLTSGSTGTPKCIQETHRGILHHVYGSAEFIGYSSDDVVLNWLPMDHVVPTLTVHLKDVCLGCQEIQVKTDAVLADPLLWLDLMEKYRVTHTWSPNFGFKVVSESLSGHSAKEFDLSSVQRFMNAGEQVTLAVVEDFLKSVAPFGVHPRAMQPSFGMAEACTCMTYQNEYEARTGTHWILKTSLGGSLLKSSRRDSNATCFIDLGPPIPGVQIRITDRDNRLVAEGVIGRFQIKGAVVTPGYLNNEKANQEAFVGDGWFNSGDLGFILNGRLTLTGREKEMIIIRGANLYCYEIEDIVNRVEGVEPTYSAACAVDDQSGSEGLAVFFVPRSTSFAEQAAIVRAIRGRVASELGITPAHVVPVTRQEFPKTTSGKIQRGQLKQLLAEGKYAERLKEMDVELENANTLPDWFFRTVWRRHELTGVQGEALSGPVLLFDDGSELAEELHRVFEARQQIVVRVRAGLEFHKVASCEYSISPAVLTDYQLLVQAVTEEGAAPSLVIHLWTCVDAARDDSEVRQDLLDRGLYSLVNLVQSIQSRMRLIVVSTEAQGIAASDRVIGEKAMTAVLARTIAQENPSIACIHVDISKATGESARCVLNEIDHGWNEPEVAYRDGQRRIPGIGRAHLELETPAGPPIKRGGLYLVSGGSGELGIAVASSLVRDFGARVLAIGRRPRLRDTFPDVLRPEFFHYEAVDVTDLENLRDVVDRVRREWQCGLDGVFHLAAEYHERTLIEETRETLERVLLPKLKGAVALHSLLEDEDSIFVHFSSVTHLFGGAMIGAYAAANRFLDAFAGYQRSARKIRSYCFAWSTWEEIGLSRNYPGLDALRARGYQAISLRRGMLSLLAGLSRAPGNLIVGLDDTRPFLRRYSETQAFSFRKMVALRGPDASVASARELPQRIEAMDILGNVIECEIRTAESGHGDETAANASIGEIERRITLLWKQVLELDSVGINDNFFELGGNSLLLARLEAEMEQEFGRRVNTVEMFRHPTISRLARHIGATEGHDAEVASESRERAESRRARTRNRRETSSARRSGI